MLFKDLLSKTSNQLKVRMADVILLNENDIKPSLMSEYVTGMHDFIFIP